MVFTSRGYVTLSGGTPEYHYYVKDHLGNNRMVINHIEAVKERSNYYPFGTLLANSEPSGSSASIQPYKFNGKELDRTHSLDLYDYGARSYDPILKTWTTRDPLQEKAINWSPYNYAWNNPIRNIDPDGAWAGDFIDKLGKLIGNDGINDGKVYVIKTTVKKFEKNESIVTGAGLSQAVYKTTVEFIETNSGNTEAFKNNSTAYDNSIEIQGSESIRQGMVDIVKQDNGSGGTIDANKKEYGGWIENGVITQAKPGNVPKEGANATIELKLGVTSFHSHPSAMSETFSYVQFPSSNDIKFAEDKTHYVFGRGSKIVYVYNSAGIQATIQMNGFVKFKK